MKIKLSSAIYRLAFYVALSGWAILIIYSIVVFDLEGFFSAFIGHFFSIERDGMKFRALILLGPLLTTILGFLLFERSKQGKKLEQLVETVEELSYKDHLTGLFNRKYVEDTVAREIAKAKRYGHSLSCLMLDIDKFKQVNDRYGHAAGDFVLQEFAEVVQGCLRGSDIVARWGGEEFVVVLPHTGVEEAMIPASRIKEAVATHPFRREVEMSITVSIGAASYGKHAGTLAEMVEAADHAMYVAKRYGGNRIAVNGRKKEEREISAVAE